MSLRLLPTQAAPGVILGVEDRLLAHLAHGGASADELSRETGIPLLWVEGALRRLHARGAVRSTRGSASWEAVP